MNREKIFQVKKVTMVDNLLKKEYKTGEIVLVDNKKALIVEKLHFGHHDIRPPFNQQGVLILKGIDFIGYLKIIPDEWKPLRNDELNEKHITPPPPDADN